MISGGLLGPDLATSAAGAPQLRLWQPHWHVLAAALPLLLYLRTMAPTVYGLDSAELTTGAYTLGIVHAPGSPLYLLLGHLFTLLPVGDVGFRLNLMSACSTALTAVFLYAIVARLTGERVLALGTAWFVASTYYLWVGGLAAELYGPQGCILAALLLLAIAWRTDPRGSTLLTLAFTFGLGLGNHLSLILLAPGFACLVLTRNSLWRRPRQIFAASIALVGGACIYLYLPLRQRAGPSLDYVRDYWRIDLATWSGFWWMITARMFRSQFFSVPLRDMSGEIVVYISRLALNFMGFGFLLGVVGIVDDVRRRPTLQLGLLLMFIAHVAFFVSYGASDKELMFVPTYVIWGIWLGLGAAAVHDEVRRRTQGSWRVLVPATLFLMTAGNLTVNFDYLDLSKDWSARTRGQSILETLEPHAVYFGAWEDIPILEYLQLVEGWRPDVTTVNLVFVDSLERRRRLYEEAAAGRPIYAAAASTMGDQTLRFEYVPSCDCYRLRGETLNLCGEV